MSRGDCLEKDLYSCCSFVPTHHTVRRMSQPRVLCCETYS